MTDRDRWGLRGPVQSCQLRRAWYSRRCDTDRCETEERGDTTLVEFHADGSLARRWHHNPDASEWTSLYEYDSAGRLVAIRTEKMTGLVDVQRYEYDVQGRKRKTLYVDVAAQRPNTHYSWGVDGTDATYSAPGAATVTTLHNTRDQPIELLFCDSAGRTLSRVEFVYDEVGHLLEEAQTNVAELLPPDVVSGMNPAELEAMHALLGIGGGDSVRRVHHYNGQGHRIETSSSLFGPLGRERNTMAYNDHGDLISKVTEFERRDYSIDDQGRLSESPATESASRSEARFFHDYDGRGNWIRKRVESRSGTDQEFSVSSVEQRALAYHL
jgi:hypothetical protein